jgi:chromosome segregation ATPase
MKIEFTTGPAGFQEAKELSAVVRYVVHNTVAGSHDIQLLDSIEQIAASHMQKPEFADLTANEVPETEDRPPFRRLTEFWRGFWGPSRREMELSKQRIAALERAERAERSSFEALAEMARVARERDDTRRQLEDLTTRIGALERELSESRSR